MSAKPSTCRACQCAIYEENERKCPRCGTPVKGKSAKGKIRMTTADFTKRRH